MHVIAVGREGGRGCHLSLSLPFFPFLILLVLGKVFIFFCQYFQMPVMFYDGVNSGEQTDRQTCLFIWSLVQ